MSYKHLEEGNRLSHQNASLRARFIEVTGKGRLEVKPDYAELRIEVVTESNDIQEAQQQNAVRMNQVIQALLSLNIDRNDIQTTAFTVNPRYDYIEGKQVFRGYEVTNALVVKINTLNEIGEVIDTVIQNGANRIANLEFKLEDEEAYYNQVLQLALQNGHSKANAIASSMRLSYMPVPIEIIEEFNGGPILLKSVAFSEADVRTPIEMGTIPVEATVRIKYQY